MAEVRRRLIGSRLSCLSWTPIAGSRVLAEGARKEEVALCGSGSGDSTGAQLFQVLPQIPSASSRLALSAPTTLQTGTRAYSTSSRQRGKGSNGHGAPGRATLHHSRTAYYEILGVPGSATQAQVKAAYYKQSFAYHPDRNSGDEQAAHRFSQISEAYLVLGSVALRKKYDRGILSQEDVRTAGKPSSKAESSSAPRRTQTTAAAPYDPTKAVYDFDEFYRAHYGEQLERERNMKRKREELQKRKLNVEERWQLSKLLETSAAFLLLAAIYILFKPKLS